MTTAGVRPDAAYLAQNQVSAMTRLLEEGFGVTPPGLEAVLFHQGLLDALDRGDHGRIAVWPAREPVAACHIGSGGRLLPVGDARAAAPFAALVADNSWRVLIGDQPLGLALLDALGRGFFRWRTSVREQRFMRVFPEEVADIAPPEGMRVARSSDLSTVAELAARLHVEDLMRPPLSRAGRSAVKSRMAESIDRGDTFVVEQHGRVVAKTDVSLFSSVRGAQIAGVYVDKSARGGGIGRAMVAAVARSLTMEGLPGVTLHVRTTNTSARAAYHAAGFVDTRALTLAVR